MYIHSYRRESSSKHVNRMQLLNIVAPLRKMYHFQVFMRGIVRFSFIHDLVFFFFCFYIDNHTVLSILYRELAKS